MTSEIWCELKKHKPTGLCLRSRSPPIPIPFQFLAPATQASIKSIKRIQVKQNELSRAFLYKFIIHHVSSLHLTFCFTFSVLQFTERLQGQFLVFVSEKITSRVPYDCDASFIFDHKRNDYATDCTIIK